MATESTVQVAPDSTGQKIATSRITRPDGTVVAVQEVVMTDSHWPFAHLVINPDGALGIVSPELTELVLQARRTNLLLQIIAGAEVPLKDVA